MLRFKSISHAICISGFIWGNIGYFYLCKITFSLINLNNSVTSVRLRGRRHCCPVGNSLWASNEDILCRNGRRQIQLRFAPHPPQRRRVRRRVIRWTHDVTFCRFLCQRPPSSAAFRAKVKPERLSPVLSVFSLILQDPFHADIWFPAHMNSVIT